MFKWLYFFVAVPLLLLLPLTVPLLLLLAGQLRKRSGWSLIAAWRMSKQVFLSSATSSSPVGLCSVQLLNHLLSFALNRRKAIGQWVRNLNQPRWSSWSTKRDGGLYAISTSILAAAFPTSGCLSRCSTLAVWLHLVRAIYFKYCSHNRFALNQTLIKCIIH